MIEEVEKLKQYLLGNVSEEESREIDLSLISDDSLTEKLLIAENELIEDFLERTLSAKEIDLFHKNFLITPKRKQKVIHLAELRKYAKNSVRENSKSASALVQENPKKWFRYLIPAFAVTGICLVCGLIWMYYYRTSTSLNPLEAEYAQLNKKGLDKAENDKTLKRINLKTSINRSSGKKSSFTVNSLTDKVLFNLELPAGTNPDSSFKVELLRNQEKIFTLNELPVYKNPNGEVLTFLLPKEILENGNYIIKATSNQESVQIIYLFLLE
ncbi:MAG: hypothetical protein LUM44_22565 [Pyrinomonadaceae bacterium]|nr:hypothetical protein [Pyrinomonadaceae bacterium]